MPPRLPYATPALEPLVTLKVAAEMIPICHIGALRDWLFKHRDTFPRRTMPIHGRRVRVLTLREVASIRSARIRVNGLRVTP